MVRVIRARERSRTNNVDSCASANARYEARNPRVPSDFLIRQHPVDDLINASARGQVPRLVTGGSRQLAVKVRMYFDEDLLADDGQEDRLVDDLSPGPD
jgi:hypothetical protein